MIRSEITSTTRITKAAAPIKNSNVTTRSRKYRSSAEGAITPMQTLNTAIERSNRSGSVNSSSLRAWNHIEYRFTSGFASEMTTLDNNRESTESSKANNT